MRRLLIGISFFVLALSARAASYDEAIDVSFPDELGGLALVGKKQFPQKELGTNYAYEKGLLRSSIFVYSGGLKSLDDGIESDKVRGRFDQVIGEVKQMEALGKLRSVTFTDSERQATAYPGCGPQFLWRGYEMVFPEGFAVVSYTYLTAVRNSFVKLRISYGTDSPHGKPDVDRLVLQLRKRLGRCPP